MERVTRSAPPCAPWLRAAYRILAIAETVTWTLFIIGGVIKY